MGIDQDRPNRGTPVITFLSDFRELVRGCPVPDGNCEILYDPSRIVPAEDYDRTEDFKDPATRSVKFLASPTPEPVTAHVKFRPQGEVLHVPLSTRSGPLDVGLIRRDGRGTMLYGEFRITRDAEWIMLWFTFDDGHGNIRYDSRFGANFLFRFIEKDVDILEAAVKDPTADVVDLFHCEVAAAACVDSVVLRYRAVNVDPNARPVEVPLKPHIDASMDESHRVYWSTGDIPVPNHAVLAFDLVYYVDDIRYKEDNQGEFFVVTADQSHWATHPMG